MNEEVPPDAPNWLKELEAKRERRLKAKLGHEAGAGSPCLNCKNDCPGLDLHFWRKICKNCKCGKESHDVQDDDIYGYAQFQLLGSKPNKSNKIVLPGKKEAIELEWTPRGQKDAIEKYLKTLPPELLPVKGSAAAQERKQLLQKQIPLHDIDPSLCDSLTEDEVKKMNDYVSNIKENIVGVGQIVQLSFGGGRLRPSRLGADGERHPENARNLPVFAPHRIDARTDDEVYPVYPRLQDKIAPFVSSALGEKFEAPTPYAKLSFAPNARLESSFPVGGPQPVFATVLNPNNRTIEDVGRLPLGFREQMCIIAPNGERLPVCTNSRYYAGPNGESLVQSPSGERFYADPDDGRYAIGPTGERLLIGANGEKYSEDPEDPRFVLGPDGEKCFVPKEKFGVNAAGERYQQDAGTGELFTAEPDNDRYVTGRDGRRHVVDTHGARYAVDPRDGRLAADGDARFLLGPKNERYVQDPADRNVLRGPNGERYVFPDDRYETFASGERFLTGPDGQRYFADPNDDRYCVGPRGERLRVGPDGRFYRIDERDGRFLVDPKGGRRFMMGPRGNPFYRDPANPDYVVGEKGDRHFVGEDIFESEPNGVRYLKGDSGIKYYADPVQERRAVGPNGEKYLIGANNELFPVDPRDKRFGRDSSGNKICLGPKGHVYYSDPKDDRYVIGPDDHRYFVPKNYFNTTPNGERLISDPNDRLYRVDPRDDRYALGPKDERFLVGPDGEVYPVDKKDGRFGVNKSNERIFFDPEGKVYRKDRSDDNCVIGPDGTKFYLPGDRYKTAPGTGERFILNQSNEKCIPSQTNDNFAISPSGKRYFVTPKGEVYPLNSTDGRFLEDGGRKFLLAPNGEKFYQDPNNPGYVIASDNERINIPEDKYETFENGERFLENPYGQKYYPSAKDDNILLGPSGEKHVLDQSGNLYKVSPDDGRLLEDDNGNKFAISSDDQKLYQQRNGNLLDRATRKEYNLPKDKYRTSANGDRFIEDSTGKKYYPDAADENYAVSPGGDRFLVDPAGNLHPVDREDARFARGPNGERFLLDGHGNVYYPDPFDDRCVVGPRNDKYFLPKDKFVTSPSGERFLRDSNGKTYIPDPRDPDLAIGPDGKSYRVNKNRAVYPLEAINPPVEDLYPALKEKVIRGPNRETYRLDPDDPRYCTAPNGERYLLGGSSEMYPVDKGDSRYGKAPDGRRFIMGPNYEKYFEDPRSKGCVVGPDGNQYVVGDEAYQPPMSTLPTPKKDPRFFTDPYGDNYVETVAGTKYPVNKEDENFVEGPDGRTYMLPPNNDSYIAAPDGQKQNLKVPKDTVPFRDSKYAAGQRPFDPKTAPRANRLPPGTSADRAPRKYFPENLEVPEEQLEPHRIRVGGIKDIEYDEPEIRSAKIHDNDYLSPPPPPPTGETREKAPSCHRCKKPFENDSVAVQIERANASFHSDCFRCSGCNQGLADLLYFYDGDSDQIYCGRDYAKIKGIPRCTACDELIFVKEYCLAENATFHVKHFCCFECDSPLAGSNYVMEESQPICLGCYETVRASRCAACSLIIKPDEPGASLKGLHFHASDPCFCCQVCRKPLLNAKLLLRNNNLYCSGVCLGHDQ